MGDEVGDPYPYAKFYYDPIRGFCSLTHPVSARRGANKVTRLVFLVLPTRCVCVIKVCPFNVVHHWETDRVPLCNMAEITEYSTEKETAKTECASNTSTTATFVDDDDDEDDRLMMLMLNDD